MNEAHDSEEAHMKFDIRVVTHIRYTNHERVARDDVAM
jgi:hypothetical protein